MLKLENTVVASGEQWRAVIRGMRNPMNSWKKSDSGMKNPICDSCEHNRYCQLCGELGKVAFTIGPNDRKLMESLRDAGSDHAKYRRMIPVTVDILAPLYWWKEFDTYKVGTVANSCSTMHKIQEKEFTLDDFSCEHLDDEETCCKMNVSDIYASFTSLDILRLKIRALNYWRKKYNETKDKYAWYQMIQLLDSSYNQRRTVMMNYEVLANIYHARKSHKLDEWHVFCDWIESLPESWIITGEEKDAV